MFSPENDAVSTDQPLRRPSMQNGMLMKDRQRTLLVRIHQRVSPLRDLPDHTCIVPLLDVLFTPVYTPPPTADGWRSVKRDANMPDVHVSVLAGDEATIARCHRDGDSLNATDHRGRNPVYLAARTRRLDLIELLESYGADVSARAHLRLSLLGAAVDLPGAPPPELIERLLDYGHRPAPGTHDQRHPISVAISNDDTDTIRRLLDAAAARDLNRPTQTPALDIPLVEAMRSPRVLALVPLLLQRGATWRIETPDGPAWPWLDTVAAMAPDDLAAILPLIPEADIAAVSSTLTSRLLDRPELLDVLQLSREARGAP